MNTTSENNEHITVTVKEKVRWTPDQITFLKVVYEWSLVQQIGYIGMMDFEQHTFCRGIMLGSYDLDWYQTAKDFKFRDRELQELFESFIDKYETFAAAAEIYDESKPDAVVPPGLKKRNPVAYRRLVDHLNVTAHKLVAAYLLFLMYGLRKLGMTLAIKDDSRMLMDNFLGPLKNMKPGLYKNPRKYSEMFADVCPLEVEMPRGMSLLDG